MSGLSNTTLAVKIDGVRELVEAYVKNSAEHREKSDKQMDQVFEEVKGLKEKVGEQNGRVGKLEERQDAHGLDIDCIKKKPVVIIFDNWKFLIALTLGLAVVISFVRPLWDWVLGLISGINLEIGL